MCQLLLAFSYLLAEKISCSVELGQPYFSENYLKKKKKIEILSVAAEIEIGLILDQTKHVYRHHMS